jgi:hypothetical protein
MSNDEDDDDDDGDNTKHACRRELPETSLTVS